MIVRAILDNPDLAKDFDYFNDYTNTLTWLLHQVETDSRNLVIAQLESGFNLWRKT